MLCCGFLWWKTQSLKETLISLSNSPDSLSLSLYLRLHTAEREKRRKREIYWTIAHVGAE